MRSLSPRGLALECRLVGTLSGTSDGGGSRPSTRRPKADTACRGCSGRRQLVMLGLGVMIGAGIFRLSGDQAATTAGPAVIVSFVIAAFVCLLAAFSFAELSSTIPAAGSVYTFSYVAMGEIWAWLVGWALILELLVAAALVAGCGRRTWSRPSTGSRSARAAWLVEHSQVDTGTNWVAFGMRAGADRAGGHRHQALGAGAVGGRGGEDRGDPVHHRGRGQVRRHRPTTRPFVPEHQRAAPHDAVGARVPARLVRQLRVCSASSAPRR